MFKRGIIIGKFMPPHAGHVALIKFAIPQTENLVVAVCSLASEPIPGDLRFKWVTELFKNHPNVKVVHITAELPQDKEPSQTASKIWSQYLKDTYGAFDVIFSSEGYGPFMAEYLGATHVPFDQPRSKFPISATQIREKPLRNWQYLPKIVRPYFVKKICVYGPESVGKTTLTQRLGEHYHTSYVTEFARDLIAAQNNHFRYKDMLRIGEGTLEVENDARQTANKIMFCDTDALTTMIYSQEYYGQVPEFVTKRANDPTQYDFHLLLDIDLAWVADPQRDLGNHRMRMYQTFKQALVSRNYPFAEVSGREGARLENAVTAVEAFLKQY